MKKRSNTIKVVLLLLCLAFSIYSAWQYGCESFGEVEEASVCVTDKYTIPTIGELNDSESYYMTGTDDLGNTYKIIGSSAEIGDVIIIYRNPNSVNAKGGDSEWYTLKAAVRTPSIIGFVGYITAAICSIVMIYSYIRLSKLNGDSSYENDGGMR